MTCADGSVVWIATNGSKPGNRFATEPESEEETRQNVARVRRFVFVDRSSPDRAEQESNRELAEGSEYVLSSTRQD